MRFMKSNDVVRSLVKECHTGTGSTPQGSLLIAKMGQQAPELSVAEICRSGEQPFQKLVELAHTAEYTVVSERLQLPLGGRS